MHLPSVWPRSTRHLARWLGAALTLLGVAVSAHAASTTALATVRAQPTNIASDNERMVSYRHQERSWETSDGATHMVVNRGSLVAGPSLVLMSSFDGGVNWVFQTAFDTTDYLSTGDGVLRGNDLWIAYGTLDKNLMFAQLRYDAASRTWSRLTLETAFASSTWGAINPAIGVDEAGTVWCGFVARHRRSNDTNLRVVSRTGGGTAWNDGNLVFGPTDRQSIERSARPVRIPGGMGMVFTVRETTFWATRMNTVAETAAWNISTIFVRAPAKKITDPYASHFSMVADDAGNVHLVSVENFDVKYFRWSPATGTWTAPVQVDDARNVAYMQIGLNNGKLIVAFSVQRGKGLVVASNDLGNTWYQAIELALTPAVPGINYNTARIEMPSRSYGPLMLLQQYAIYETQTLMVWYSPLP